ncbi:sodium-coupled monocarboxylate transporter 1-like [Macrobrachium nipponense]|uniref:sodium-coupled monocarboxylate transporter 1-like n=1 Tax=Macrobrachium nipponense TaxID=159736 RepID=UPI0030C7CF1F
MAGSDELAGFGVVDYAVFCLMLCISTGIGIFFGIRGNKNTEDFLMGGRSMSTLPVSISLLSSFISAISILGFSGETYAHGLQLSILLLGAFIGIFVATVTFLPVFYPLKLTSVNEYIEMRFHSKALRLAVLLLGSLSGFLYTGLCLYAPTLALASVTPISVDTYIVVIGVICTIYCSIGGLKAVVWTDTFQMFVIVLGLVAIVITGSVRVGGIAKVWEIGTLHNRTELFDFNFNPYQRHNFWNIITMGVSVYFSMYGANQTNLQRACSVPTMGDAIKVYLINLFGMVFTLSLVFFSGLCAFVNYAGCDPISRGHIFSKDQIIPYFVMDKVGFFGIPGLFVATLLSGALSSMSSVINSLVAMIWSDLEERVPFFRNMSQIGATLINKLMSCAIGAIMVGLAFFCKGFSGLFQAAFTILGIMAGPTLGIFTLGLVFPHVGKKGAWCGILGSVGIMTAVVIGANQYNPLPEPLPVSTELCNITSNGTVDEVTVADLSTTELFSTPGYESTMKRRLNGSALENQVFDEDAKYTAATFEVTTLADILEDQPGNYSINDWPMMYLFGISYTLYTPVGAILCLVIGIVVTMITGSEDLTQMRPELIAPMCRWLLPKKAQQGYSSNATYTPIATDFRDVKVDLRSNLAVPPPHMMRQSSP